MNEPRFPGRPDHPDFWLISEAVQDFDSAADDNAGFDRLVRPIVDIPSLTYTAEQRAARALGAGARNPLFRVTPELMRLQATWIDGFVAGARFRQLKDRKGK